MTAVDTGREVPWSPRSESGLLGACLYTPVALDVLFRDVAPEDFYKPANAVLAAALSDMHRLGEFVSVESVALKLKALGHLETVGGAKHLTELMSEGASGATAARLAAEIRDEAGRRALITLGIGITERGYDHGRPLDESAEWARRQAADIETGAVATAQVLEGFYGFMAKPITERWLVPGLLERSDRLIITGSEGAGKSTLLRQMAVQLAAGIHPFRKATQPAVRVLVVDVENSENQIRREMAPLAANVEGVRQQVLGAGPDDGWDGMRLEVRSRQQGIDLLGRPDRRWFTAQVEAVRPDVIVSGPIYKMHDGEPKDEGPARDLAKYFDEIRTRYDCALILEAHSPHGDAKGERTVRPFGASLWMRWPEFGFGLRPSGDKENQEHWDFARWRGPRDRNRTWPIRLVPGKKWPWVNAYGSPEDIAEDPAF